MSKIRKEGGRLIVPDDPTIPFITGDGVGSEITPVCKAVVDAAVSHAYGPSRKIDWMEVDAGESSFNKNGSWLPGETLQAFKDYLVGIKGPLKT
ncbi:MAG: NADP-dependent isocitrate dehydrogenase, partial [Bacteroidales bacterium]|nr:NADP-dependent isocitrate dehydrogenase [Bacteroidales bacterium]